MDERVSDTHTHTHARTHARTHTRTQAHLSLFVFSLFSSFSLVVQGGSSAPPVIHCSAGIGRSGVFAALLHFQRAMLAPMRALEVMANEQHDHKVHALATCCMRVSCAICGIR